MEDAMKSTARIGMIVCVVFSGVTAIAEETPRNPIAVTESGLVIGSAKEGVNRFLGIPYAAAPVGEQRWRPPETYGQFPSSFLQATQFGNECTQPGGAGSEDCLFL